MDIDAAIQEIRATQSFLTLRNNYASMVPADVALRDNLAKQMATTIQRFDAIAPVAATKLTEAIANDAYGEFTHRVQAVIDAAVHKAAAPSSRARAHSKKGSTRGDQIHKHPDKAFTQDEHDILKSQKLNLHTKLTTASHRLGLLGIWSPHEQTLRWWSAFVGLLHYHDVPSPKELHNIVTDLRSACQAAPHSAPFTPLKEYPADINDLPIEIRQYAYGTDHTITINCIGLSDVAMNRTPVRKTHRLLKSPSAACAPPPSRPNAAVVPAYDTQQPVKLEPLKLEQFESPSRQIVQIKQEPREVKPQIICADNGVFIKSSVAPPDPEPSSADAHLQVPTLRSDCGARGRIIKGEVITSDNAVSSSVATKAEITDAAVASANINDYAKAAIQSLLTKTDDKKQLANEKKKLAKLAQSNEHAGNVGNVPEGPLRKHASSQGCVNGRSLTGGSNAKSQGLFSKRRGRVSTKTYPIATSAMPKPPAKGADLPPHDYKNGRIYWKGAKSMFRVIRIRGQYGTERQIRWKTHTPAKSEWKAALSTIDEYKSAGIAIKTVNTKNGPGKTSIKSEKIKQEHIGATTKIIKKETSKVDKRVKREVVAKTICKPRSVLKKPSSMNAKK